MEHLQSNLNKLQTRALRLQPIELSNPVFLRFQTETNEKALDIFWTWFVQELKFCQHLFHSRNHGWLQVHFPHLGLILTPQGNISNTVCRKCPFLDNCKSHSIFRSIYVCMYVSVYPAMYLSIYPSVLACLQMLEERLYLGAVRDKCLFEFVS